MTANIWVIRKESRYEMAGAFCGSLIIHVVLFFLMASTSIYYPATGEVAQFDIFWLSPPTSPIEAPTLAAVPDGVTAAYVKPERPDVKPGNVEPPHLPVVDKNIESPVQPPPKQADEEPPVELIAARAVHAKPPSPPVKPLPKPKKTAILIPKAEPEREKSAEAVEPPAKAEAAKPETQPEAKPEPPPPPQPPLPPEKADSAIAEEQRQADLSAIHERLAQEKTERQRQAAEKVEQEQRAAEAAREKAEQKSKAAEAANEKANEERKTAEAARLKAEHVRQEKRARAREQAAAEAAREKAEQKSRAAEAAKEKANQERQAAEAARQKTEQERLSKLKAEREQLAAAQLQREKLAREREKAAEKAERERLAAAESRQRTEQERLAAERVRQEKLAREREQAAEKAERERQTAEALRRSAEQERLAAERMRLATLTRAQTEQRAAEALPKETPKPRPAEKPPIARGIVIPSIHGDLKLIIAESNEIKLTVLFREYPKSRRNRGLTRSEASREQKITPIVVKTKEKTREVVIEKVREGIYIFTTEPDGVPSATATFTLKSYEQSQRAKTMSLGAKTIAGKAIIARILMPDAILWEDESAFSGSMEDSGGVTKFNSETGLIWKEYRD